MTALKVTMFVTKVWILLAKITAKLAITTAKLVLHVILRPILCWKIMVLVGAILGTKSRENLVWLKR